MSNPLSRRVFVAGTAGSLLAPAVRAQDAAANYPSRPVRLVIGFAAGTGPDTVGRLLAQKLTEAWAGRAAVFVDNKTGAGGHLAATEVARAAPDGYTWLLSSPGMIALAPATSSKLQYDPFKDFTHVTQLGYADLVLVTNPKFVPATKVREFAAWARKQSMPIFMGTFGAGTTGHFASYLLSSALNIKIDVVHYRSTADVTGALLNGDIAGVLSSNTFAVSSVANGKLTALGITGARRNQVLSGVPTFKEQGFPVEVTPWQAISVPSRTPAAIIEKLYSEITKVLQLPEVRSKLDTMGTTPSGTTPQEFSRNLEAERKMWAKAVAASGFKATE